VETTHISLILQVSNAALLADEELLVDTTARWRPGDRSNCQAEV
jgi:hypothetical protein